MAAHNGYAPAMFAIGAMYEEGKGVSKDMGDAKKWYGRAQANGSAEAKAKLAKLEAAEKAGKGNDASSKPEAQAGQRKKSPEVIDGKWVKMASNEDGDFYVDPSSVMRDLNVVEMWTLIDRKKPDGKYMSQSTLFEYECAKIQMRPRMHYLFEKPLGRGVGFDMNEHRPKFKPLYEGTIELKQWRIACGQLRVN